MISSGIAVDGSHGGLGHHLHFPPAPHPHMTFEPLFKGGPGTMPPVPEFLRPLPKPAPLVPRYNGAPRVKYHDGPVNLAQHKDETSSEESNYQSMYSPRLFPPPPPPFSHYPNLQGPYGSLYPAHYNPMMTRDRPNLPPPSNQPLSPLEAYPSPHSAPNSPAATYSPPAPPSPLVKPGQSVLIRDRDRRFKVPSGKEGSLKHRILTRPESSRAKRKAVAPPTPVEVQTPLTTNNNSPTPSFNKGSLIQLSNGELKRVEDMTTEDFVLSAERSPALRLDPSTVVRIEHSSSNKRINVLTLSYGEHRTQVEFESSEDHPYFVYGQGWASCNPEKTLALYGLRCRQLQVGDVCISLSPRPATGSSSTATSSEAARKKRRWSAPDQFCNEEPPPQTQALLTKPARKTKE